MRKLGFKLDLAYPLQTGLRDRGFEWMTWRARGALVAGAAAVSCANQYGRPVQNLGDLLRGTLRA